MKVTPAISWGFYLSTYRFYIECYNKYKKEQRVQIRSFMDTIRPQQIFQINTIDLQQRKKSVYWTFVFIFLGIISLAILGLYAITSYEHAEQLRMENLLSDTGSTKFIPAVNQE